MSADRGLRYFDGARPAVRSSGAMGSRPDVHRGEAMRSKLAAAILKCVTGRGFLPGMVSVQDDGSRACRGCRSLAETGHRE